MTDAQKRVVGAVVRWLLMLLFATLTRHRIVDGTLLGAAVDDLTAQIVGYLGVVGVGAWSVIQKWRVSRKIAIALALPAGSAEAHIAKVEAAVSGVPTPQQAATAARE